MRNRVLQLVSFSVLCFLSVSVVARDIKKVKGKDTYVVPETVTLAEGKRIAIERAKVDALSREFGTIVTQAQGSIVENRSGKSLTSFMSVGETMTKGEWLETIGEPVLDIKYENGHLAVTAEIKGRARELKTAKVDFCAKILGKDKVEKSEFCAGEDLFMSFISPVDGYLSVYLIDGNHRANRLFPYQNAEGRGAFMKHGEEKILFDDPTQIDDSIDEYKLELTSNQEFEQNILYIIYSPNQYSIAIDNGEVREKDEMLSLPKNLSYSEFMSWLTKCRILDSEMRVDIQNISIQKKK